VDTIKEETDREVDTIKEETDREVDMIKEETDREVAFWQNGKEGLRVAII
jgi:vacuolar-type H+-ATPase subunit E/Vma4